MWWHDLIGNTLDFELGTKYPFEFIIIEKSQVINPIEMEWFPPPWELPFSVHFSSIDPDSLASTVLIDSELPWISLNRMSDSITGPWCTILEIERRRCHDTRTTTVSKWYSESSIDTICDSRCEIIYSFFRIIRESTRKVWLDIVPAENKWRCHRSEDKKIERGVSSMTSYRWKLFVLNKQKICKIFKDGNLIFISIIVL